MALGANEVTPQMAQALCRVCQWWVFGTAILLIKLLMRMVNY